MRITVLLFSFIFIFYGCETEKTTSSQLFSLVPNNCSILITTNSIEGLNSALKNNSLFNELSNYTQIKKLERQFNFLKYLKPQEHILISLGKDAKDSLQIAVFTKSNPDIFVLDSIPNRSVETLKIGNNIINKTTLGDEIIYSRNNDGLFFASNVLSLVEQSYSETIIDKEFEKIYKTSNLNTSLSILLNLKTKKHTPSFFLNDSINNHVLTEYLLVDTDVSQDQIVFNGITKASDSSKSLINVFKNTIPQENKLSKVCPASADGFLSFTFNSFTVFKENLSKLKKTGSSLSTSVFELTSEIGLITKDDHQAVVLYSIDAQSTKESFLSQDALDSFRDINIYPFDNPDLFSKNFFPFISYNKASKYINLDDFFVFSDDSELLKEIITSYQNSSVLSEARSFQNIMEQLSDESSLLFYSNSSNLNSIFDLNFSEKKNLNIDAYKASAIQFIYDTDFAHVNAIIQKNKSKATANSVSEDINITLDAELITNPQFVNNHTNGQMEIVAQDINNDLYLISKDGKVLWKKRVDGKILGTINQMDTYKNGRLQLVFATPKRVYVLDRDGKDVGPFPLKFNDPITQPLSVFDYDNNRNYRLLVTQGRSLLMYDKQGKIVSGFTYKKSENDINSEPNHFRIGRKDYIVFVQGNELEILDRVGKTRINVKNNISFSDNGIYLYNNKFTTTTDKGDLIQIDQNGKMSSANLNLGEKHAITSTSKSLVTLSENELTIKSHPTELDFGNYTAPRIFYLNDKIYVSVTDLQTNKVYLFDSLGKSIPNFPVYGNSPMDLDNLDKKKGLEFVVKGESNSIIIYKMN